MVVVRKQPDWLKGSGAEPGCRLWRQALLRVCPVLTIKPELRDGKMSSLATKGLVRTQGWESPLPDYQPRLYFQDSQTIHHTDTLSLILPTVPISSAPNPQSSKMPWASLLCPPWPFPRPFPPPGFCPGLSLCQEPLTCFSCFFLQVFCSPGGLVRLTHRCLP